MVLSAGTFLIPGKVERQRAIFRVNGSAPQERVLNSMDKKDIVLDLPPATNDPALIDVKIELPDAASPSESGSTDTRKLGLSITNLKLINRPYAADLVLPANTLCPPRENPLASPPVQIE